MLKRLWNLSRGLALANGNESGIHLGGRMTRRTDAAISSRYLLMKRGSDDLHVGVSGATDAPYAVCTDESAAAEELVNLQLLGCADRTVRVQTDGSAPIAFGDFLVPAANGRVKKIPVALGATQGIALYWIIGMALDSPATAAGEIFEIMPGGYWYQY